MRLIHTSDWHLGIQLHGVSLIEEQREAVSILVNMVKQQSADAVLIAGDIFDHAVSSPETIRLYDDFMCALCLGCNVPVMICAGNHDGAARLSACGALLRDSGLYIAGRLSDGIQPILLGNTAFFLLPYFNPDEVRCLYPDRTIQNTTEAMSVVCDELRKKFIDGQRNILAAHCYVAGGETSESDRSATLGGAGKIPPDTFSGFDYVALGHLHRAQQFTLPNTIVRYSGTPYPYSFTEAGQTKSFTLLDTDSMECTVLPISYHRNLRIVRGTFDHIMEFAPWDKQNNDYIKAEVTDCIPGLERTAMLREYYPNLLLTQGMSPLQNDSQTGLTTQELEHMLPRDLVVRFCEEIGDMTPDEELLCLFEQQASALDGGERL